MGLILQCRLHQKSARQTKSKANSWRQKTPARLCSGTQSYGAAYLGPRVTKPYEFIGFGDMEVTKPYEFIGFGALEVTKPYEFIAQSARAFGPASMEKVGLRS